MKISKEKFYHRCAEAEMNAVEAVKKSGISTTFLSSIKLGRDIRLKSIGKIAHTLKCEISDLIEEKA